MAEVWNIEYRSGHCDKWSDSITKAGSLFKGTRRECKSFMAKYATKKDYCPVCGDWCSDRAPAETLVFVDDGIF